MRISVVIPYYKDLDGLGKCLEALRKQSLPVHEFEILIINNHQVFESVPVALPENARLYHEPQPGSYAARNLGVQKAQGDIIAFTDSDCIPDQHWLEAGLNLFETSAKLERIAGRILLSYRNKRKTSVEVYESVYAFDQKDNAHKGLSVTANFFAKKSAFDSYGLFPDNLFSGGDFQWNRIASSHHSKIAYGEAVCVTHPARFSFDQLRKKARRVAGGQHGAPQKKANQIAALARFIWELRPPVFEWKKISKAGHLTDMGKVKVWFIRYWFRAIKAQEQFKIEGLGKGLANS